MDEIRDYRQAYAAVGEDIHEAYRQFGTQQSNAGWGIARLCLLSIKQGIPRMLAYKVAASDAGVSERSVRMYVSALEYFSDAVIEEFCTAGMGVMHFAAAMQAPNPYAAAKWAFEQADKRAGKVATVDEIFARFVLPQEPPEPEVPGGSARPLWTGYVSKSIIAISDTPTRLKAGRLWGDLQALLWPEEVSK